jgi:transposase-like protein
VRAVEKEQNKMKHEDFTGIENTHEFRERSLKRILSRILAFYFFMCAVEFFSEHPLVFSEHPLVFRIEKQQ